MKGVGNRRGGYSRGLAIVEEAVHGVGNRGGGYSRGWAMVGEAVLGGGQSQGRQWTAMTNGDRGGSRRGKK